jgi:hypothetical protein
MHCTSRRQRGRVERMAGGVAHLQNFHVELVADRGYLPHDCHGGTLIEREEDTEANHLKSQPLVVILKV